MDGSMMHGNGLTVKPAWSGKVTPLRLQRKTLRNRESMSWADPDLHSSSFHLDNEERDEARAEFRKFKHTRFLRAYECNGWDIWKYLVFNPAVFVTCLP